MRLETKSQGTAHNLLGMYFDTRTPPPPSDCQPQTKALKVGLTLDLVAKVYWLDGPIVYPTWSSSDLAVATVAPIVGGDPYMTRVTGVATGVTVITATVSGKVQQFIVDVVPYAPDFVTVVPVED